MIQVVCHTNLDLHNEQWPSELPAVPNKGDIIVSQTKHKGFQLELQVVAVRWKYQERVLNHLSGYIPHIELHMTEWQRSIYPKSEGAAKGSITAFYEWYAPLVGKSVGAFI